MKYWLIKTEPEVWSIEQQVKSGNKGARMERCKKFSSFKKFKKYEKG